MAIAGVKCPECGGRKIWRKGSMPSRKGPKPRLICYDCGKTFNAPVPKKSTTKKKS